MAHIYDQVYFGDTIIPLDEASLSIASSAVLYGLSVYTVFPVCKSENRLVAFRLVDHFKRLCDSSLIIGIDTFSKQWTLERFTTVVQDLIKTNNPDKDVFMRATVHVSDLVAGTRSRGLTSILSLFIYDASPIVPQDGARLKTSVWRRIPDYCIPARAKVNGAYINSILAKQDALDSGYDDCIFLDEVGHVCESSAANIFLVRDGVLITPGPGSDILEGINRKTIMQIATDMDIKVKERSVDLTEMYIADEVFLCGTSAFIAPVKEIDARPIGNKAMGPITARLREKHTAILHGKEQAYQHFLTII